MLDIKLIREQPQLVKAGISAKGYPAHLVDEVAEADRAHRELIVKVENLRAARNQLTKDDLAQGKKIKLQLKQLEPQLSASENQVLAKLNFLPNLPLASAPQGTSEADNVEVRKVGQPPTFDFPPLDHLTLGQNLGLIDFVSGAKVAGSQFYFLTGVAARLELALIQFAFDFLTPEDFLPVITPDLAKSRYYLGTGYAPKGAEAQTYTITSEDLGLIATAEVTLAGKHADELIPETQLPLKYIGYSHCFRQEAGAYGKYSRGLYRVHQFTKAEMFIYCLPEDSDTYHHYLLNLEEKIFQALGISYRVLEMCTGDLGAMAAKKYDLEAWMPGRNDYGEITSTSNCTDYQARNFNIRVKRKSGAVEFAHLLNGTAIATSRALIAILENYQNADGSITIPKVLRSYLGKDKITSGI